MKVHRTNRRIVDYLFDKEELFYEHMDVDLNERFVRFSSRTIMLDEIPHMIEALQQLQKDIESGVIEDPDPIPQGKEQQDV